MELQTRRTFTTQMLGSLAAFGLIETLLAGDLFGDAIKPVIRQWMTELNGMAIDRTFRPGECSTISDHKDNVHWFKAQTDTAFIFNVHIMGYNPESTKTAARIYIDPEGEKVAGGLTVARKISSAECHRKYG